MNDKPKVKIVSLCSNEAPYLPQWVHHHYWHGISAIDLYVNRISDNTLNTIKKLQKYYPRLKWYACDWVDRYFRNKPPAVFYPHFCHNHAYANCEDDIDYLFCIDIDEFWTAINCRETIPDSLVMLGYPDAVIYEWFLVKGLREYTFPLYAAKAFYGHWGWYTKLLVKTGMDAYIDVHTAWGDVGKIVNADGTPYMRNKDNIYAMHPKQHGSMLPYFVLHDSIRSMANNFSKFVRGSSADNKLGNEVKKIFNSRRGLFSQYKKEEVKITNNLPSEYYSSYYQMCVSLDLFSEIRAGRIYELLNALEFCRQISFFKDEPFTKKLIDSVGALESVHEFLIEQLCALDSSYKSVSDLGMPSCASLLQGDKGVIVANLLSAIKLYPFAVDDNYEPLFLKTLLDYLFNVCDIGYTKKVITDHQLLMKRKYGRSVSNYLRQQIINRIS